MPKYNPDTSNLDRDTNKKTRMNFDKVAHSVNNIDNSQIKDDAKINHSKIDYTGYKADDKHIKLSGFAGDGEYDLSVKNNGDLKKNNRFLGRYYENNLIIPLYINTGSLSQTNYQEIIDTRRKYSQVGMTVIINPTDGLFLSADTNGTHPDSAYTTMINDLQGIGIRVIAYITTFYLGTTFGYYPTLNANAAYNVSNPLEQNKQKLEEWFSAYPQIDGIFYDEYWNGFDFAALGGGGSDFKSDLTEEIGIYKQFYKDAYDLGASIVIANPGTDAPVDYWDNNLADVFLIKESSDLATVAELSGQLLASSGHEFVDKRRKGAIAHSQDFFNYEGGYRSVNYASWYYSTEESGSVQWRIVSNHIEQQANFFAQSMKNHQVIGIHDEAFEASPDNPNPKQSLLGYYSNAGDVSYTLNTGSSNNWYLGGLHFNIFRNTSDSNQRFMDIVALANASGGGGGSNIRFYTNTGSSTAGVLRVTIDRDGVFLLNNAFAATPDEITATSAGVAASIATTTTEITTNGDSDLDDVTLANGVSGQMKNFIVVAVGNAADSVKITPANMVGGTQITFAANPIGLGCSMIYADNEGWVVNGNNGGVIT